ncbi:hypothetical protein EYB35_14695 [Bacillus paranthracis]|nr:hypothetical protein BK722_07075 [Bacillus thuringiensis serovar finitimus]QCU13366.1 hypothetical protein BCPR1_25435 [Bacillus paranthracis]TBL09775.1 hypothetical protein EYB35_14695 [Bacillus paranthracis]TNP24674.1 hypothetical protein FH036_16795 [Bacillus sp. CD3-5]
MYDFGKFKYSAASSTVIYNVFIPLLFFLIYCILLYFCKQLNYSPLNVLMDCLKWEIPKYRNLVASNSLGYPRSSYG